MSGRRSNVKVGLVLIAIAALLVLTAIGVWKLGTWIGFFLVYNWIFNQITSYGMNTYVARIASILLGCAVWFGAVYLWKKNRKWSVGVIVALIVLQSTFLFFAERNRYFSATTGEPTKYYTINPMTQEIQVFDREVYDAFGQKSQRVNFEIAQQIERQRATRHFPNEEIPPERIKNFYDFSSGQPLVYYSQDGQGRYHFYLHEGFDPHTGRVLLPVSAEVVDTVEGQSGASSYSPIPTRWENGDWVVFALMIGGVISLALFIWGIVAISRVMKTQRHRVYGDILHSNLKSWEKQELLRLLAPLRDDQVLTVIKDRRFQEILRSRGLRTWEKETLLGNFIRGAYSWFS